MTPTTPPDGRGSRTPAPAAVLRGAQPRDTLGARGLAQLATSECPRERAILAAGLATGTVAAACGLPPPRRIPVFAAEAGNRFEHTLLADGGRRVVALYQAASRLPANPTVADLRGLPPAEASRVTSGHVAARAAGRPASDLIIQARLHLRVGDAVQAIRPDLLVVDPDHPDSYRVGEIKAQLDRAGYLDPLALGAAAIQLAASALALTAANVPTVTLGDLLLRAPSGAGASLRVLHLDGELHQLAHAIAQVPVTTAAAARRVGGPLASPAAVQRIPHRYRSSCWTRCALVTLCAREAHANDDLATVTDQAADQLPGSATIHDATQLLDTAELADHPAVQALRAGWDAAPTTTTAERKHPGSP